MRLAPKLVLGALVYGFTLCVALGALTFLWLAHEFEKPGPAQEASLFVVERGTGLNQIITYLEDEHLIHEGWVFKLGTIALNQQANLKAGEYEITPGMSAHDIVSLLHEGKVIERRVTLREGLTSFEIVRILSNTTDLKQDVMGDIPEEGALLPETYSYQLTDSASDILFRMEKSMQETIEELWPQRAENLPFDTKEEAITLASIVEKETGVAEERRRVAGVFINRLRQGIALQTDPTVIYAITKGRHKNDGRGPLGRRLLTKDLQIDSPYNTYKYPGLPPGPIANPGRASIEAVLNPETHDYIFFVADGTGGHMFAKTLKEHNQNVAKWRKIRREKKN